MSIFDKLSALETQYDELMQRLGTAGAGADFEQHVALVVRVLRDEQNP